MAMNAKNLTICVINNGSALLLNRTLESLKRQTDQAFSYEVVDCSAFWTAARNTLCAQADYVMFLYSGSRLENHAVAVICEAIRNTAPSWLYFDEQTYSAEINGDLYGVLEKPDFDPLGFVQDVFTGEGAVFSRAILDRMQLKYQGTNFGAALTEMTVSAACRADGAHIRECLMTRHNRCELYPDEEILLSDALKELLKTRDLKLLGIKKGDGFGLCLFPAESTQKELSIIVLYDSESSDDHLDFTYLNENVEVIHQTGSMPYREKCLLGAQKAHHEILCFLDAGCIPPSKEDFDQLLYYASLPYAGFVSPCLFYQSTIIYAGAFACAGKPFRCERQDESLQQISPYLSQIRQTAIPAQQFFLISKTVLLETETHAEMNSDKELSKLDWMLECAFQLKAMGKHNLYIGSIWVQCTRDADNSASTGFYEMLLRRKDNYFLDPCCPAALRSWMRARELKGVKAYLPEQMSPYSPSAKKLFVLSHELSLTGAPVVLAHAVRILKEANWQIVVVSPIDGPLKEEFLREGIPVLILEDMDKNESWMRCASDFDLILVNTVVPFRQIEQLCSTRLPVMWWLHDAKSGYEDYLRRVLPETLSENIHIFSVSQYADDAVRQYRPQYQTQLLLYGLKDEAERVNAEAQPIPDTDGRKVFISVGTVIKRKGQDILAQAVHLLPDAVRSQCLFLFIGKCIDRDIFQYIKDLEQAYPESVRQIDAVAHDDIFNLYKQAAAVICSSRDDPLPTFMAETMMVSGVCICSENTGTAAVIQDGVNGYIYRNDDPAELADCIRLVTECSDLDALRNASRKTFEDVFSMDIFRSNLIGCVAQCIDTKGM